MKDLAEHIAQTVEGMVDYHARTRHISKQHAEDSVRRLLQEQVDEMLDKKKGRLVRAYHALMGRL